MLRIYGVPISVHTRKAVVLAIAKQLPHEVVPVVPVIPGNPPPNWRDLSPTGRIPVLSDGDFTVSDSSAICAYLERLQPSPSFYPAAPRDYAQVLWFEQYAGTVFSEVVRPLFHEVFVHPKVRNIATDTACIAAVLNDAVPQVFGYLEAAISGDFVVGPALTVADVALASNLITYQYIGFDLYRARFPRLGAWFDRVASQPAVREALRREQPVVDAMGLKRDFLAPALV